MVSTFTPNIQLEEPARGDDVGTWDTPVNSNMTVTDLVVGGVATIPLNNSPVVLSAAQFRSRALVFSSTLTGSVAITFPSTFIKDYIVFNGCTGSSAFIITLQTTAAGSQVICAPPREGVSIYNDGTNIAYENLGRIGSYMDYAGSSTPAWITACTVPPYLNCDGTVFSSATFPLLSLILGGTTLPNSKGRARFALDQGAGLISTAVFSSSLVGATGGAQTVTLGASQIPNISAAVTVASSAGGVYPVTTAGIGYQITAVNNAGSIIVPSVSVGQGWYSATGMTGNITSSNTGGQSHINVPPAYLGGLTLIRSA